MEQKGGEPIPFVRIEEIVQKYGGRDQRELAQQFGAWRSDALTTGLHPLPTANRGPMAQARMEKQLAKEEKARYATVF